MNKEYIVVRQNEIESAEQQLRRLSRLLKSYTDHLKDKNTKVGLQHNLEYYDRIIAEVQYLISQSKDVPQSQ